MIQPVIHYSLHFILPAGIAYIFFRSNWKQVYLIFLLTMLVDLDHLLARPVFSPCRCSIGFHWLHSYVAIGLYVLGLLFRKTRVIAIGLLMHMLADAVDCLFIFYGCKDQAG